MKKRFTLSLLILSSIFWFLACNEPSATTSTTEQTVEKTIQKVMVDTSTFAIEGIDYLPYKYVARTAIPPKPRTRNITGGEAIAIAEQWAANQGYMTKRVTKKGIVLEQGEFATDTNDIIRNRYNTLQPYAFGVRQYGGDQPKWAVGFQYVHPENNIGRAVSLDMRGDTAIMQPTEVRQDWIFGED
ncbi:MAG: hypothetical protein R3E32_24135 [Chitinophagales bacterium]